jgi:hypothetical protein
LQILHLGQACGVGAGCILLRGSNLRTPKLYPSQCALSMLMSVSLSQHAGFECAGNKVLKDERMTCKTDATSLSFI